jgi:uncharacterized phage protein (TIGR01671 family)
VSSFRPFKFRIWSIEEKNFLNCEKDLPGYLTLAMDNPKHYTIQQYVEINDVNKKEIYEGDIIVQYPEIYPIEITNGGFASIRYDQSPKPLKDIVLHRGYVFYYPGAYWIYTVQLDGVTIKTNSVRMFDKGVYEVVGNMLEDYDSLMNPGLEIDLEDDGK